MHLPLHDQHYILMTVPFPALNIVGWHASYNNCHDQVVLYTYTFLFLVQANDSREYWENHQHSSILGEPWGNLITAAFYALIAYFHYHIIKYSSSIIRMYSVHRLFLKIRIWYPTFLKTFWNSNIVKVIKRRYLEISSWVKWFVCIVVNTLETFYILRFCRVFVDHTINLQENRTKVENMSFSFIAKKLVIWISLVMLIISLGMYVHHESYIHSICQLLNTNICNYLFGFSVCN